MQNILHKGYNIQIEILFNDTFKYDKYIVKSDTGIIYIAHVPELGKIYGGSMSDVKQAATEMIERYLSEMN